MSESKDEYKYIRISKEEDRCMIAQILAKEGYTVKFERKKLTEKARAYTYFVCYSCAQPHSEVSYP